MVDGLFDLVSHLCLLLLLQINHENVSFSCIVDAEIGQVKGRNDRVRQSEAE